MPRPRTYRVEAIVLRRIDFGEADRVLVLYTRERGKQPVVAKGIRRISSRLAGHLDSSPAPRFSLPGVPTSTWSPRPRPAIRTAPCARI